MPIAVASTPPRLTSTRLVVTVILGASIRSICLMAFGRTSNKFVGDELDAIRRARLDAVPQRLELRRQRHFLLEFVASFITLARDVPLDSVARQQVDDVGLDIGQRLGQAQA